MIYSLTSQNGIELGSEFLINDGILMPETLNKIFYDVDVVYTYKNKWIDPKDKYFIWKLLHPKCRIYVNIKECIFPNKNEREYLDNLYLNKNKNIKNVQIFPFTPWVQETRIKIL